MFYGISSRHPFRPNESREAAKYIRTLTYKKKGKAMGPALFGVHPAETNLYANQKSTTTRYDPFAGFIVSDVT
jgi:hypothetical protein